MAIWHMGFVLPSVTHYGEGLFTFRVSSCLQCRRCIVIELYAGCPDLHGGDEYCEISCCKKNSRKGTTLKT